MLVNWVINGVSFVDQHYLAVAVENDPYNNHHQSYIYKWDGSKFVVHQTIATYRALEIKHFTIKDNHFLCIANSYGGWSQILVWNYNKFYSFYGVKTISASSCEGFAIGENYFVAFGDSYYDQYNPTALSSVYKWKGGTFVHIQSIPTHNVQALHHFHIKDNHFLAVANHFKSKFKEYHINSNIYRWNGVKFEFFQNVSTMGASDVTSMRIQGETYLVFANERDDRSYHAAATVYQAIGPWFRIYQKLDGVGASGVDIFEHKGTTYLAVVSFFNGQNHRLDSRLYQWV